MKLYLDEETKDITDDVTKAFTGWGGGKSVLTICFADGEARRYEYALKEGPERNREADCAIEYIRNGLAAGVPILDFSYYLRFSKDESGKLNVINVENNKKEAAAMHKIKAPGNDLIPGAYLIKK